MDRSAVFCNPPNPSRPGTLDDLLPAVGRVHGPVAVVLTEAQKLVSDPSDGHNIQLRSGCASILRGRFMGLMH